MTQQHGESSLPGLIKNWTSLSGESDIGNQVPGTAYGKDECGNDGMGTRYGYGYVRYGTVVQCAGQSQQFIDYSVCINYNMSICFLASLMNKARFGQV